MPLNKGTKQNQMFLSNTNILESYMVWFVLYRNYTLSDSF